VQSLVLWSLNVEHSNPRDGGLSVDNRASVVKAVVLHIDLFDRSVYVRNAAKMGFFSQFAQVWAWENGMKEKGGGEEYFVLWGG
jgi:hypothetical protein